MISLLAGLPPLIVLGALVSLVLRRRVADGREEGIAMPKNFLRSAAVGWLNVMNMDVRIAEGVGRSIRTCAPPMLQPRLACQSYRLPDEEDR